MDNLRLPIVYDIPKDVNIINAFHERAGKFDNPYDEFTDICLKNITWAAYHLLMWQGRPLRLAPFQSVILDTLWNKTFPILLASRGAGKSFLLGVYAALRAMLTPGSKVVIVAASFRQSKIVFEYIEQLYNYSSIFRACCPEGIKKPSDSILLKVGDSTIRALPLGNGEKIRGIRASNIICDEFASIAPEVFQVVVRGFASVASNPIEAAVRTHEDNELIKQGRLSVKNRYKQQGNQIVYTGTATYQFNHFYKLFQTHKAIIEHKMCGSSDEVNQRLGLDEDNAISGEGFLDYKDYSIVSLPYFGLPEAYMDEKQIAQAKLTMPKSLFQMEYECIFPTDSDGFYKRSLINQSTPGYKGIGGSPFAIEVGGQGGFEYVMGIDPARKTDNFSISVLKLVPENNTYRNVYCYSMRGKSYPKAVEKIRELLTKFNIVRIAMDAGGGGMAVEDLLQDSSMLKSGEKAIWRLDDDEHKKFSGLHILEVVNFNPTWISEANYGLASDIEHRKLLFPLRSVNAVGVGSTDDDVTEDEVWEEIDEQINEMCKIVVTPTKTGVQHFDTPDVTTGQQGHLKSYQRKDRYSALLLSAHAARKYWEVGQKYIVPNIGGWADRL